MKELHVRMPDGSVYAVPLDLIARNRAAVYASEFGGDIERSLREDTLPLFAGDSYEAADWAAGNMNWSDVSARARQVSSVPALSESDFQEGWVNGLKRIVDAPDAELEDENPEGLPAGA